MGGLRFSETKGGVDGRRKREALGEGLRKEEGGRWNCETVIGPKIFN